MKEGEGKKIVDLPEIKTEFKTQPGDHEEKFQPYLRDKKLVRPCVITCTPGMEQCLITSHVHLIIGSSGNALSNIMRDLKRHTSEELHKTIANNKTESRREWMLWMMERAAKKTSNDAKFQLWQPENHPIELTTPKIAWQKLDYTHL